MVRERESKKQKILKIEVSENTYETNAFGERWGEMLKFLHHRDSASTSALCVGVRSSTTMLSMGESSNLLGGTPRHTHTQRAGGGPML